MKEQIEGYKLRIDNRISIRVNWRPKVSQPISSKEVSLLHQKIDRKSTKLMRVISEDGIAISITIASVKKTTPSILILAKTVVDVLRKVMSKANTSNIPRFLDDNKIKYISVKYSSEDFSNNIHVEIVPFNDFLQDLEFANKILSGHYDDLLDVVTLKKKIGEEYSDANQEERKIEYLELLKNREKNIGIFGEDLYTDMIRAMRMAVQDEFIVNMRPKLFYLYNYHLTKGYFKEGREDYTTRIEFRNSKSFSKWLQKVPLYIILPSLPFDIQTSKEFMNSVRRTLTEFRERNEILTPVYSPFFLDVIYKPAKRSLYNCADVDYLMKLIIPEFNRVFKYEQASKNQRKREIFKDFGRSKYTGSPVVGYNSIEVPRINDNEEGILIISISRYNVKPESIRERIDKVINRAVKYNLIGESILTDT
jgi:hypothetical protein